MDKLYITLLIVVILFMVLLIVYYLYPVVDSFSDTTTKIMENVPDVPTIKLIEKNSPKSIFQKIMSESNTKKIPFEINTSVFNYSVVVPNYENYNFAGKGLAIAASGDRYRYVTGLFTNLYVIRKYHKSNIPIEIFYVGESEKFTPEIEKLILSLGNIKIINILDRITTNLSEIELKGYQTKPLAAVCSSFEEVVVMDADALCFVDPHYLFFAEGYIENNMVLFKDYVDCLSFVSKDFMETIGIGTKKYCDYTHNYEIDSSCVILNKKIYWDALFTICVINIKSDSYHKSKNVLGDKDTWLIGSMFLGLSPFITRPAPYVFIDNNDKVVVGHLQSSNFVDGDETKEIFTHYNNQKIIIGEANIEGFTYNEVKNPTNGELNYDGYNIPDRILECFKVGKEASKILEPLIPMKLKMGVKSVNGVSKGLIP